MIMARPATGKTRKQLTLTVDPRTHDTLRHYSEVSGKSISQMLDDFAKALDQLEGLSKLEKFAEYQDLSHVVLKQRTQLENHAIELISQCRFEEAEEVLKQL